MRCNLFEGRRFLVQVLLGVSLVVWSASPAWAQEKPKAANKPAEYAEDTFVPAGIRVWRSRNNSNLARSIRRFESPIE